MFDEGLGLSLGICSGVSVRDSCNLCAGCAGSFSFTGGAGVVELRTGRLCVASSILPAGADRIPLVSGLELKVGALALSLAAVPSCVFGVFALSEVALLSPLIGAGFGGSGTLRNLASDWKVCSLNPFVNDARLDFATVLTSALSSCSEIFSIEPSSSLDMVSTFGKHPTSAVMMLRELRIC